MKIDTHTIIYKAAQSKFDVKTGSIVEDNDLFTLTSDDGRTFTNADFTSDELAQAKTNIESEIAAAETAKESNKAAAQAKLAALGLTADDLKALGL